MVYIRQMKTQHGGRIESEMVSTTTVASMQKIHHVFREKKTYLHLQYRRVEAWLEGEGECVERKEQLFPISATRGLLHSNIFYNTTL